MPERPPAHINDAKGIMPAYVIEVIANGLVITMPNGSKKHFSDLHSLFDSFGEEANNRLIEHKKRHAANHPFAVAYLGLDVNAGGINDGVVGLIAEWRDKAQNVLREALEDSPGMAEAYKECADKLERCLQRMIK